jgi:hypothetical protein
MSAAVTENMVITEDVITTWAERIRGCMARTVEAIVATGRELVDAKAAVGHGHWLPLLREVGISIRTAQMFMTVANSPLANACHARILPAGDLTALCMLAGLPGDVIEQHIADGKITPNTRRQDVYPLVHAQRVEEGKARRDAPRPVVQTAPEPEAPARDRSTPRAKKLYAVTWYRSASTMGGGPDAWPQTYFESRAQAMTEYRKVLQGHWNEDVVIYEATVSWQRVDDTDDTTAQVGATDDIRNARGHGLLDRRPR